MDERHLKSFLAIAELGSVSRAADRLGVAQPSLSQLLLRLEDELGVKLFERTTRGVTPSAQGRLFQEYALNILREMQRARDHLRANDADLHESVAIGLPSSVSMMFGVPLLLHSRATFPRISLRLSDAMSGHIKRWLDEGTIDLGILHDVDSLHHMSVRRIALERMFLIGPPGAFGPSGEDGIALSPAGFSGPCTLPLILPSNQHGLRQFVERTMRAEGLELYVDIELDSLAHIKSMVSAGLGYTILSHAAVADELRQATLCACMFEKTSMQRMIYLVRNPRHKISRSSVQIGDALVGLMQQMILERRWMAEMC